MAKKFSRRNSLKFAQKSLNERDVILRFPRIIAAIILLRNFFQRYLRERLFGQEVFPLKFAEICAEIAEWKGCYSAFSADNSSYHFVKKFFISALSAGKAVLQEVFP